MKKKNIHSMGLGVLDRYRGRIGSKLPEQVKKNGQEGSGEQNGKEVKKQVNKGFDTVTGEDEKPAQTKQKRTQSSATSQQRKTGPQASNASSQVSREESNQRHIQKLVDKGQAVRVVKPTETPQNNAPATGETNGHQWVDLGLPSGTKWATCNVGAATSEQYGNTYYWGSITPYIDYNSEDTPIYDTKVDDISGNPQYDPATVAWGKEWRMPTLEQFKELMFNCTWEYTTLGRLTGFKVISKTNGNYIFLPVEMYAKTASYWTSTPGGPSHNTNQIYMNKDYMGFSTTYRKENKPIRAVTK